MNDEPQYSRGVIVAAAAWLTTALLLLVAWATWALAGSDHIFFAILTAETACVASIVAAVAHLRCYASKICRLIRVTNGYGRPPDAEVRELNRRR